MSRIEAALRKAQTVEDGQFPPSRVDGSQKRAGVGFCGANVPSCLMDNLRREIRDIRRPVLGLCALGRGEGTSTLTSYLAGQFALDKRVLAIDCNFESPKLHDLFGTGEGAGVSDILLDEKGLQECLLPVPGTEGLFLLPAGRCGKDALPFLGTSYSERILEEARDRFEVVLIDAPSDERFSGTLGLCLQTDGVVWVVRADNCAGVRLEETLEIYREAGVRLLGAALNRVNPDARM